MHYFFIFGKTPSVSAAEVFAWLTKQEIVWQVVAAQKTYLVLDTKTPLPEDTMNCLGGSIKYGEIINKIERHQLSADWLDPLLGTFIGNGKFHFGFSVYPQDKKLSHDLRGIGLDIKKMYKARGQGARLVMSKQQNLSSVVVQKNKLVSEQGAEIIFLQDKEDLLVGRTLAVQPFEDFNKRDYDRPKSDDLSGMIPPKLAQMMVNIAKVNNDSVVLDPFCGSGTIVQELLLQGVTQVYASDKSQKAVSDTKQNINWLGQEYQIATDQVDVFVKDVREIAGHGIKPVDAIVAEPYLGPPAKHHQAAQAITTTVSELTILYSTALEQFARILKPGGRVVMVWPVFVSNKQKTWLPYEKIVPNAFTKVEVIPPALEEIYFVSPRKTVVYSRDTQHVQREIMVLTKE